MEVQYRKADDNRNRKNYHSNKAKVGPPSPVSSKGQTASVAVSSHNIKQLLNLNNIYYNIHSADIVLCASHIL